MTQQLIIHPSFKHLPKTLLDARTAFDCGEPELNHYLQHTAGQHDSKNIVRTFCGELNGALFGYYSLNNAEVDVGALPAEILKRYKLPKHRLPVVRLVRLAVDVRFQRQGLGEHLLIAALSHVPRVAELSGCVGMVVDAKPGKADFYRAYGFRQAPDNAGCLFMPLPEIQALFAS
ncbi:GNAT family N-acetyltransferase [Rivihabitans pingtungensis]|uniref:GNAT family N-acetyltransferase n=1 Tax=Rivihabitans pingtungensis TaxID=1054498 RepID=UPI0023550543|nr:GNAT family N-acetyltransferase [Rivihabitans pingtungensis]MCK6436584.1 GNAT family N-acetyltransferase [Rivihabitans pingtungensis]